MTCGAYQSGDQMVCPCGLGWDVNDPDPPQCKGIPVEAIEAHRQERRSVTRITATGAALQHKRDRFERWALSRVMPIRRTGAPGGPYDSEITEAAWQGYCFGYQL